MSETESNGMACYDCDRRYRRDALLMAEVPIDNDNVPGYELAVVPICPDCRGRRYGYDCPHCGIPHDSKEDARYCCERAPGEAPDCPDCGRRMKRTAHGMTATGEPTCEFAECEACGIGWGKFTGWHELEEGETEAGDKSDL